jgi:NADPH:quinone reductase-like Zn-dependent oxidoreductase
MKAITNHRYGPPHEVMTLEDVAEPVAGPGDVVVRAMASSVNPADWHIVRGEPRVARLQMGLRRPKEAVLGCDVAGVVEAVGPDVTGFAMGDEVFGSPFMRGFGAFAELVAVPADCLVAKPAGVSFEQAASVPLAGLTALKALRDNGQVGAGAGAGQRVLLIGASGGVGTFAVQIAKALGAEVTGVCSGRNVDLVRSLGADHVIDYTRDDLTAGAGDERYDVVLAISGDRSPGELRRLLTPEGRLVLISGDSNGKLVGAMGRLVKAGLLSPFVSQALVICQVKVVADDLRELSRLIEAGQVRPVIEDTRPLVEVPEALRYLESSRARGKVVITHTA